MQDVRKCNRKSILIELFYKYNNGMKYTLFMLLYIPVNIKKSHKFSQAYRREL